METGKTTFRRFVPIRTAVVPISVLIFLVAVISAQPAGAYTTQHPKVMGLVGRAVQYLDTASHDKLGGKAIIGLALYKANHSSPEYNIPLDHPNIVGAAQAIRSNLRLMSDPAQCNIDMYSLGISLIFLTNYDSTTYRPEIETLLAVLLAKQKDHGGWGYPVRESGDTSMTQYGVLGMWEAKYADINVSMESVDAVASWLLKTQDPSGAFGYQGRPSGSFTPVAQIEVRHSMAVAGLGSVYLCADLLGVQKQRLERDTNIPSALKEVKPDRKEGERRVLTKLDPQLFRAAEQRGDEWMKKNYKIDPGGYTLYYLYGLERYCSVREMAEGKLALQEGEEEPEGPHWYNDGVDYLAEKQDEEGTWEANCGTAVDTAFGVLFLLRSMRQSIIVGKGYGAGTLIGGRGLPKDGSDLRVRDGKVEKRPMMGPFEALMEAMESDDMKELAEKIERMEELPPKQCRLFVSKHKERLQKMIGQGTPEARMVAVKALGRTGDLNNAPTLILALSDPDVGVVLDARDSLRRLSRKINGFGLPDEHNAAQRHEAIRKWKAWYLAVRPDTEF